MFHVMYNITMSNFSENQTKFTYHQSDDYETESEYEGYDEYYHNNPDGGYFLYSDTYKQSIPGYLYFFQDEKTKDGSISDYKIDCKWKILREQHHSKYHEYVLKYKQEHMEKYWKYVNKYGCCLEHSDEDY